MAFQITTPVRLRFCAKKVHGLALCAHRPTNSLGWARNHGARHSITRPIAALESEDISEEGSSKDSLEDINNLAPADVKQNLIETLDVLINNDSQLRRVERSILRLESLKVTPITPEFTEMALAGEWRLRFSSLRTRSNKTVRIRRITQRFEVQNKRLVNEVTWSFLAKNNKDYVNAVLSVVCPYVFVGPGRLDVSLEKHNISITDREDGRPNELPDLQSVITDLRLALPIEHFDPSGLLDISYIEPDFRISRFLGKRLAGVRNVFTRVT